MTDQHDDFDAFLDEVAEDDGDDFFDDSADGGAASNAGASTRPELSADEMERRTEAFQREVQKRIRIAMSPKKFKPEERIEAVQWLGESGEPSAIETLVKIYEKDRHTTGMQETAAYALGQFKALELAISDPETESLAIDNLTNIVMHNEFGKRANPRPFRIMQGLLTVTLVLFLGGGLIMALAGGSGDGDRGVAIAEATEVLTTPTPDTPDIAATALAAHYRLVSEDYERIQAEVDFIKDNSSQSCENQDTFNQPPAFVLSPAGQSVPELVTAADELETIRQTVDEIINTYNQACAAQQQIDGAQALDLDTRLFNLQGSLQTTTAALESVNSLTNTVIATEEATEIVDSVPDTPIPAVVETTPEPTVAEATAEVTPTEAPDTRNAEFALRGLIDEVIGINGALVLIETYWQQAANGSDIYCNQPQPIVPENYALELDLIGVSLELDQAVQNVNQGLDLARNAVAAFYAACGAGTLQTDAEMQLTNIGTAQTILDTAQLSLDALRR